jgi:hypothetical protein
MKTTLQILAAASLATALAHQAFAASTTVVVWKDLKKNTPEAVEFANGIRNVTISGYMLPVDRDGSDVYQFLLMPAAGGCSHTKQLPPDQILLVSLRTPIEADRNYQPVSVTGELRQVSELSQFYILDGVTRVATDYSMRGVDVVPASTEAMPNTGSPRSPWKFLNRSK